MLPTSLPGIVLLEPDVHRDEHGRFVELFQRARYAELGVGVDREFVQDNLSSSTRGTLRGLHYQRAKPQGKLVSVTRGEIYDVAVDLRRASATFGQWYGTTLSADNGRQLWVPEGFAHGFLALSRQADVLYKCTAYYDPTDERAVRWDDADLAISWPLRTGDVPLVSAKDAAAPTLREVNFG